MGFSPDQVQALEAKLSPSVVKGRKQAGRNVSYIEGWHAIAEANRIFGFDGWTRETVEMRLVSERERQVGRDSPKPGWSVSYVIRVKVVAFAGDSIVTREGVGSGHGIDADLGLAHESAVKEAETDAMKRALMTFGNPFGLALYDKSGESVGDEPEPDPWLNVVAGLRLTVNGCGTIDRLDALMKDAKFLGDVNALPDAEKAKVRAAVSARKSMLLNMLPAG